MRKKASKASSSDALGGHGTSIKEGWCQEVMYQLPSLIVTMLILQENVDAMV
jgi:hypothetical protein